jgi:hypothetical protein
MSHEGTRWVEGAVLGLAIVAVGCGDPKPGDENADETDGTGGPTGDGDGDGDTGEVPDNGIPLELVLAKFNATGKFVLLRFSEPMAPVDGVDPGDFRISLATSWRYHYYGEIYSSTTYWDPHYYFTYDYYNYNGYAPLKVEAVANGSKNTDIVLRLAEPLDPGVCPSFEQLQADYEMFDELPDYQAKLGLFPHYSPGAVNIKSADQEVLAAIGPDWVENPWPSMDLYDEYGWPNLDPEVEIPCDFFGTDP